MIKSERTRDPYAALQAARERQQTELFKAQYARHVGIEGTISQGVHMGDLRRSRSTGAVKTRLTPLLLTETPRSRTRRAAFAALAGAPG